MANETKKYASLENLQTFKENIDDKFATKTSVDKKLDASKYVIDDALSSTSSNPVQNKVLDAEFEAISTAMNALEYEVDGKANTSHNHDDRYYTETEIDTKLSNKSDSTHNHDSKYDAKGSAAAVQTNLDAVDDKVDAHIDNTDIHVTTTNKSNWNTAYTHSQAAHARTDATKVADSTTNGNILINGTETNVYTHPSSGVTAGTYKSVTVNEQGHVIGGTNPTTLAGYGITDAEAKGSASSALADAKEYTDTVASGKSDISHNHNSDYDAKGSADIALDSAKSYTDTKTSGLASTSSVNTSISTHNTSTSAHSDIRLLITDLTTKLNNFLDVDDTTTDELSEILTLINNNKGTLESLTSSKVNVSDIVNNLTTSSTSKVLSAAQGVAIKTLIDTLQSELDGHTHEISDVSGLQSALDGKADSSHGTHVSFDSTNKPKMDGTSAFGTSSKVARADHVHPTDTSRASKTEFDSHTADTTKHITSTERTNWGTAYTHSQAAHAPSNAQPNQNAFSNIAVGSTTVSADSPTDTINFVGSNVTITPDTTNDKVTFSVADGSTSTKGLVQLTNSTSSTSTTTAATPSSVKSAYDLANTAKANAATAQTRADSAYTLAESKVDSLSDLGITTTADELNYIDGVTSNVQTQLDAKVPASRTINGKVLSADITLSASDVGAATSGHTHSSYVNQNAFSNVKVGNTTIAADTTTDTLTLVAGNNITLTPDATGDSVTITAKDTTYTLSSFGVTATATELNKLDGVTATSTELNYVDGVTSNIQTQLDGKAPSGHTHNYAGSSSAGGAATSANKVNSSLTVKLNGGSTEGTNLFTFNGSAEKSVDITPSAIGAATSGHNHDDRYYTETEINTKLSGKANTSHGNHVPTIQTADDATFLRNDNTWQKVTPANIGAAASSHAHTVSDISDLTATATELNYVDGVTSNIQTQLNSKQATISGGASTITSSNLTASRALVSNSSGKVAVSAVTSTELGYLDGVTSAIQTQLDSKADSSHVHSNYVPTSRTINGKALSGDITLSASDVGASAKNTWYGTCSTTQNTAAKVVTTSTGDFSLTTGNIIYVLFTYAAYTGSTLNVDGTGAVTIKTNGTTGVTTYQWAANEAIGFIYDGTYFRMLDGMIATTTYYGMTKLSSSTSSSSNTLAATSGAVKSAYDLANTAKTAAETAQTTADSKAPAYTYGTADMTAGTSTLTTGTLYFVYE